MIGKKKISGVLLTGFSLCLLTLIFWKYNGAPGETFLNDSDQENLYGIPLVEAQATPEPVSRPTGGPAWLDPGAVIEPEPVEPAPAPPAARPPAAPARPRAVTPPVPAPAPEPAPIPPPDENQNRLDDRWEEAYNITEPGQDSDGDGLYDSLEYVHKTNPREKDTDGDGFTDAEEVLDFRSDPLDKDDPGTFEALGIRITGFEEGQIIADARPLVKGVAPPLAAIEIVLRSQGREEKILGQTEVSENGIFLFESEPLEDGEYELVARLAAKTDMVFSPKKAHAQADESAIDASVPVKIRIDTTLEVVPPRPTQLADREITEEMLLESLRIEIRDRKPVLIGRTNFRTEVIAAWRSIVLTSALIADSPVGEFEIAASDIFDIGEHEVFVQAVRPGDGVMSGTVRIPFTITEEPVIEPAEDLQPESPEAGSLAEFFQGLAASPWAIPLLIVIVAAFLTVFVALRKKRRAR